MKISTSRETLIKGIQTIQAGVSSKTGTIPILQNFLMETEERGLKVVFTDLEMAIKHHIEVNVKTEGSITIPIKKFMEIIQNLEEEADINVAVDEASKIAINSGKSKFKISGAPKNDYPIIPDLDETNSFKIPAGLLFEMISGTIFSASTEDDRHFLSGLLLKHEKGILSVVATDGRRLAISSSDKLKTGKDFKIIVPSKILGELVKFIKSAGVKENAEVTVGLSSNQIGFKVEKTVFISRLVEGNFPAYEQIIPKTKEITVEISSEKLLAVTKRAAICSNERNGSVKYIFKKGVLSVSSESQNMNFEDELEVDYKGSEFQVNFNPRFVMDVLKTAEKKNVIMEFSTPAVPALIRIADNDAFIYIIMPLRTQ